MAKTPTQGVEIDWETGLKVRRLPLPGNPACAYGNEG